MERVELSEKEKRELEQFSAEERESIKRLLSSKLARPIMKCGIDVTLMTFKELEIEAKCERDHMKIVRKRAEELRFFPDDLTEEEQFATLRCLTSEELKPYRKAAALYEKNTRLQAKLSPMEKIDVRLYVFTTLHFSKIGPLLRKDPNDKVIRFFTKQYFKIMRKYGEKVYEKPYYFLKPEHKKRVLKTCAKSVSEEDQTKVESCAQELEDNLGNTGPSRQEGVR